MNCATVSAISASLPKIDREQRRPGSPGRAGVLWKRRNNRPGIKWAVNSVRVPGYVGFEGSELTREVNGGSGLAT